MKNTLLLAVYKAGDKRSNLHIAFDQFQEQVTEMDGMKWRYSEISEYNNACENLFKIENGKPDSFCLVTTNSCVFFMVYQELVVSGL